MHFVLTTLKLHETEILLERQTKGTWTLSDCESDTTNNWVLLVSPNYSHQRNSICTHRRKTSNENFASAMSQCEPASKGAVPLSTW